jgi:hypothetical protein
MSCPSTFVPTKPAEDGIYIFCDLIGVLLCESVCGIEKRGLVTELTTFSISL